MTLFQSLILGIVQGLTEFLPVSSSGHLVLAPFVLGWEIPGDQAFVFDVLVQVGTLLAVILFFWQDLTRIIRHFFVGIIRRQPFLTQEARLGWFLILATVPAGGFGLLVKERIEAAFSSPAAAATLLLVTGSLLLIGERVGGKFRCLTHLTWKDSLWMGFFQALAVFPGISRSGATITGGMTRNLDRPAAARFSFLMSVPIMLAAGSLALVDLLRLPDLAALLPSVIAGLFSSLIVGYLSIRWLLSYLTRRPLYIFAAYCFTIGLLVLASVII